MNKKQLYFDKDVNLNELKNKKIGVIGFGNQGRAQALNLIDSGMDVVVGLRKTSNKISYLSKNNIPYGDIEKVVKTSDLIAILLPDKIIPEVYNKNILPYLKSGQTILFSHGYNIHYRTINYPEYINVIMVAPSGAGKVVREKYKKSSGVPALLAIENDFTKSSLQIVTAYSKAIGSTRVCAFFSTFKEETETDLFGEQVILTGGIPYYINKSLKVLLESGYSPIVAWFVCYYELKTIVDLFHENGFDYLYDSISDTAKYGGLTRGEYLIDKNLELKMKKVLSDIQDGSFHKELNSSKNNYYKTPFSEEDENKFQELFKILFNKNISNNKT